MAQEAGQAKEGYKPRETTILGEDDYNNYNGIYTCVECGKNFLGREDSFLCMHCLNLIHGD